MPFCIQHPPWSPRYHHHHHRGSNHVWQKSSKHNSFAYHLMFKKYGPPSSLLQISCTPATGSEDDVCTSSIGTLVGYEDSTEVAATSEDGLSASGCFSCMICTFLALFEFVRLTETRPCRIGQSPHTLYTGMCPQYGVLCRPLATNCTFCHRLLHGRLQPPILLLTSSNPGSNGGILLCHSCH